jgi:predicted regulator of Ras-like GTPase activity (Roadblock/LC7/MglB family)
MLSRAIGNISLQPSVIGAMVVDREGLIVARRGEISPLLGAHLARLWAPSQEQWTPVCREIHWQGGVLLLLPMHAGTLLVLHAEGGANLGMIRLHLDEIRSKFDRVLSGLNPDTQGRAWA